MHEQEIRLHAMRTASIALALGLCVLIPGTASSRWKKSAEPFKETNVHFETNASACDMGIQLSFDTEGVTTGSIRDANGRTIYKFGSRAGMRALGGQTEGFLEGVEPQITELLEALGCEASDEEDEISLDDLFHAFPEGDYRFDGKGSNGWFQDEATLTYAIPAGPEITAPEDGDVVPDDEPLLVEWEAVIEAILPELGPVDVVGYHVVVVRSGDGAQPQYDVDLPASETSVEIPAQYLEPATFYDFEVLATEASGNQTITEGFFCTTGLSPCEEP